MRFMVMVKANQLSESGAMPSKELMAAMGKFNEEMLKAGVLLGGEGLKPSAKGVRLRWTAGKRPVVIDGPFTEAKELVAGFWLIQVKSREEAIEWMKRCPAPMGPGQDAELEIRQLFEAADFPPEVLPPEAAAREDAMRAELRRRPEQR